MRDGLYERLWLALLLMLILAQAVFAAFPGIDLAVSAGFADGQAGFPWNDGAAPVINRMLKALGEFVALGLVFWCLVGARTGLLRGGDLRAWGFAALSVVASSALVNLVLKAHVGRARPAQIEQFGGTAGFTPAWQVTDQCARNCSFTSGEVALAFALATAAIVLLWPQLSTLRARVLALGAATAYVGAVTLLRIGLGRHFLSDAVFSILFTAAVALILYPPMRVAAARTDFDLQKPVVVGQRLIADLRARARAWLAKAA